MSNTTLDTPRTTGTWRSTPRFNVHWTCRGLVTELLRCVVPHSTYSNKLELEDSMVEMKTQIHTPWGANLLDTHVPCNSHTPFKERFVRPESTCVRVCWCSLEYSSQIRQRTTTHCSSVSCSSSYSFKNTAIVTRTIPGVWLQGYNEPEIRFDRTCVVRLRVLYEWLFM